MIHFLVSSNDAILCCSEIFSQRKFSISERRIPVSIANSTIGQISAFLQLFAATISALYSPFIKRLSRRLMPLGIRIPSTGLAGMATLHSSRAILIQCLISMRSYCAARTPSFTLRSLNSESLALVSFESGVVAIESLNSQERRLCSASRPFLVGVTSWLYRVKRSARVVALGAETFVSPASILASTPRTQTTASFLLVNVL